VNKPLPVRSFVVSTSLGRSVYFPPSRLHPFSSIVLKDDVILTAQDAFLFLVAAEECVCVGDIHLLMLKPGGPKIVMLAPS
jgi:hypothetical protein